MTWKKKQTLQCKTLDSERGCCRVRELIFKIPPVRAYLRGRNSRKAAGSVADPDDF
jgi:hypothetical protein